MRKDIITGEFQKALKDYAYLLNRKYPRKSILKIIGDRYLLNTFQRILLSRGVFTDADIRGRLGKMQKNIRGQELYVDAYNVLFTLCNYLLGRMVFLANDSFLRDTGEVYGKPQDDPVLERSLEMCLDYLVRNRPSRVEFLLDSPVSHSAELAGRIRQRLGEAGLEGDAQIDRNPDARLIRKGLGNIATSDSDVLDQTQQPVIDLARLVLEDNFKLNLPDLGKLLA